MSHPLLKGHSKMLVHALAKADGGYKVRKLHKGGFLSKKPMPKAKALKQLAAYHVNKKK